VNPVATNSRSHSSAPITVERWASTRRSDLDNLKVGVVAAVIAIHGVLSYSGVVDAWSYTELREVTLSPMTEIPILLAVAPVGYIVMPLLFLVAGLLTVPSLHRKGPAAYARDRLLRLGVPFLVFVLLVQPTVMYALEHQLGAAPGSYWASYLGQERQLDTGPLWFVGVLLIFSLVYTALDAAGRLRPGASLRPITARRIALIVGLVAPASFVIRIAYPYGSDSGFTDLSFWEWPACAATYGLGIAGARRDWMAAVDERLHRRSRVVTLVAAAGMVAYLGYLGAADMVDQAMGGWRWPAAVFAGIEATLAVFGSIWLLGAAQRHLRRRYRWGPPLARSSYGAFIVAGPMLIGLALALRAVPLAAELKAIVVAAGGVVASFALAWLLIRYVRGVARVF
jgi:hypothetical protein